MTSKFYSNWTNPDTGNEHTVELTYAILNEPSRGRRDSLGAPEEPDSGWEIEIVKARTLDNLDLTRAGRISAYDRWEGEILEHLYGWAHNKG